MISAPSCSAAPDQLLAESVNSWVGLCWQNEPVNPPKGVPYGSHLASYVHCTIEGQIFGLNFQWFYIKPSGEVVRCHDSLTGIETVWFFRYDTLKIYPLTRLNAEAVCRLELPAHPIGQRVDQAIEELRTLRHLHQFRFPGFPDDYNVTLQVGGALQEIGGRGEQVWVRARRVISRTAFMAELLNQPVGCEKKKGELVRVNVIETPSTMILTAS